MVVDLIVQCGFPDLIESGGLVEVHGVTVRHDEPMEDDGQAFLSYIIDFLGLPQNAASSRDQQFGVIVGINIAGNLADDWAGKVAVQAIYQHGFQYRSLKDDMIFP